VNDEQYNEVIWALEEFQANNKHSTTIEDETYDAEEIQTEPTG
jgi:hypothetical protein